MNKHQVHFTIRWELSFLWKSNISRPKTRQNIFAHITDVCKKKVATEPWIFLFQNLFDSTASHDAVWIKRSVCHLSVVVLVA